jgi:uncharacterized flavoprotein (TIGR03862 family)
MSEESGFRVRELRSRPGMTAAVIGAGPAGLIAAEELAKAGVAVTVYDRMPSAGRKFLLAGRGGLNLTHIEELEKFLTRYRERAGDLRAAIEAFPSSALREWSMALGQKTFAGSSGRVFPESFKSSPLLRAWLRRLDAVGVAFKFRHRWLGWNGDALSFETPEGVVTVRANATILALGGASWPRLGSDGFWSETLAAKGVAISPLRAANCGFEVAWSETFRARFEGEPLKRISLSFGGETVRGEAMITRNGIEGGAVYALSASLREAIRAHGNATLYIALRPDLTAEALEQRLTALRRKQSFSNFLRKSVYLEPVAIGLLQEAAANESVRLGDLDPRELAGRINHVPVTLSGVAPVESAISTAGGIPFSELDGNFMLKRLPGVFAAGEMLDWEAPTGGYLLQASFATGVAAGRGAVKWLGAISRV